MIIVPVSRLVDPLGVTTIEKVNQNKVLLLKRFGELYKRFPILNNHGGKYVFCKYIETIGYREAYPRPCLLANGTRLDERPEFRATYVSDKDLKRIQRYLNRKAFFSRVKNERRLYKLVLEESSFIKRALHTFVHAWLPELPDITRGRRDVPMDKYDIESNDDICRKVRELDNERIARCEAIRVLPTTTDPRMM